MERDGKKERGRDRDLLGRQVLRANVFKMFLCVKTDLAYYTKLNYRQKVF